MTWINKNDKLKPYDCSKDDNILEQNKDKPIHLTFYFKTKRGKVYTDTLQNMETNGIKWEWWQPCSSLKTTKMGNINPSKTPSEMIPIKRTW